MLWYRKIKVLDFFWGVDFELENKIFLLEIQKYTVEI